MSDREEILKLKDGESYTVLESDYGKCEIWLKHETYFLFEIPMYGGQPHFHESYPKWRVNEMIEEWESWT